MQKQSDQEEAVKAPKLNAEAPAALESANKAAQSPPSATVTYSMSPGLTAFLAAQNISLAISSYQSGKFYLLGRRPDGGLMVHERFFKKAMGIHVADKNTIVLATLFQVMRFANVLEPDQRVNGEFDACYVPRVAHVTGALDVHDVGLLADGRVLFVNTLYNCLATTSERHSFAPVWKPRFISKIIKEDRCHLNGLAMEKKEPRYVTAVSRSDTIDGWRDRRAEGGVVIDVASGEVVIEGLSMPHSPRLHAGKLWVLISGTGELGWIELGGSAKGTKFHPVAFCPGFVRGLAFHGRFALVGLSKPRHERFEGLALDQRLKEADSEPWCGLQVIDLESGACAHWFRIDGAVTELYDVGVIPGVVCPMALGFASDEILSLITHQAGPL